MARLSVGGAAKKAMVFSIEEKTTPQKWEGTVVQSPRWAQVARLPMKREGVHRSLETASRVRRHMVNCL